MKGLRYAQAQKSPARSVPATAAVEVDRRKGARISIKSLLFGSKVDLDTLLAAFLIGARASDAPVMTLRQCRGSASAGELSDPAHLCVEVGGAGRCSENNFDHHGPGAPEQSASRQVYERLGRLVAYVDAVDRGDPPRGDGGFPNLTQLIAGMLLSVAEPKQQMEAGLQILRLIVERGLDPAGSLATLYDELPAAERWAQRKREHDAQFANVLAAATWLTTKGGRKLAVVETTWFGAPGALYGAGAEVIVALNPRHGDQAIRKFTVSVHRELQVTVRPALEELAKCEQGWGGPAHGTICGSPQDRSSALGLEEVVRVVQETL